MEMEWVSVSITLWASIKPSEKKMTDFVLVRALIAVTEVCGVYR